MYARAFDLGLIGFSAFFLLRLSIVLLFHFFFHCKSNERIGNCSLYLPQHVYFTVLWLNVDGIDILYALRLRHDQANKSVDFRTRFKIS